MSNPIRRPAATSHVRISSAPFPAASISSAGSRSVGRRPGDESLQEIPIERLVDLSPDSRCRPSARGHRWQDHDHALRRVWAAIPPAASGRTHSSASVVGQRADAVDDDRDQGVRRFGSRCSSGTHEFSSKSKPTFHERGSNSRPGRTRRGARPNVGCTGCCRWLMFRNSAISAVTGPRWELRRWRSRTPGRLPGRSS